MPHFTFPEYELSLELDPLRFEIWRDGRRILALAAFETAASRFLHQEGRLEVELPGQRLILQPGPDRIQVRWQSGGVPMRNSFLMEDWWYGQGELIHQGWPLNRMMLPLSELITADNGPEGLLCIQTPAWLSSAGVALLAEPPLHVGLNQPPEGAPRYAWDLGPGQGPHHQRPRMDPGGEGDGLLTLAAPDLAYEILLAPDLPAVFRKLVQRLGHPRQAPAEVMLRAPIWTTWARYKSAIDQRTVLDFAAQIRRHDFPHSILEIDDRWQVHYGDLSFDPQRFPQPAAMIQQLHDWGFQVTAWVIPFISPDTPAFRHAAARGYLVRDPSGSPCQVPWWQGTAGLLDFTHPGAQTWFLEQLQALQAATGLDGFKFDGGEAIFLPPEAVLAEPGHRNEYTRQYVRFASRHYRLAEVRSGWLNQAEGLFFRQWDKSSGWGVDNGLASVIPGALTLGLTGYPFILPDMVGGNAYRETPDAELLIRWTQLNALLPAVQFGLAPWDYGPECTAICRQYARLHAEFLPQRLALAHHATQSGEPLVRPVSWLAPHDERALLCADQFLLGDDWLAAPVIQPSARARDVYLPPGAWRDPWDGNVYPGPQVLHAYPAPLERLPYFERLPE